MSWVYKDGMDRFPTHTPLPSSPFQSHACFYLCCVVVFILRQWNNFFSVCVWLDCCSTDTWTSREGLTHCEMRILFPLPHFSRIVFLAIVRATSRAVMICFELVFNIPILPSMQTVGDNRILRPRSQDSVVVFLFFVFFISKLLYWCTEPECVKLVICCCGLWIILYCIRCMLLKMSLIFSM